MPTKPSNVAAELPDNVRQRPEYAEGAKAFADKKADTDNPHPSGEPRQAWFAGWFDSRTNKRLGHIFKKHGMTHP